MNWNDTTLNPKVILGYYHKSPSLKNVALHRLSLLRDGPTGEIVLDVAEFPERPSPKWPPGANTCQITIRLIGISQVEITRWGTGVVGELEIKSVQGTIEVSFSGEGTFRILCSHVAVANVSGYINGRT